MVENDKAILRPITLNDTDNILRWRNSENVKKYFCMQEDLKKEEHEWWIENKVNTGKVAQFIIVDKSTNKDIGTVYIRDIDNNNLNGEFGIYIGEESARGKGLGEAAMNLICEYGFKELNLHKIYLRALCNNEKALSLYKKVGFIEEGIFKDHVRLPNKDYIDLVFMGRINPYE